MPQYQPFDLNEDRIIETTKVTAGYFSDGAGTLEGTNMVTASLTASQDKYYVNIQKDGGTKDEFSITFGSKSGLGSPDVVGHTKAVYQYYADLLLFPEDIETNGFQFDGSTTQDSIWIIAAERANMKDRWNKKNWTLTLGGGGGAGGTVDTTIKLTDDSDVVTNTPTPVGERYNIVSGTLGSVHTPATSKTYGWFYPNFGILVLNGAELSASLPGEAANNGSLTINDEGIGFGVNTATDGTAFNHLKLANAVQSGSLVARSEEDQITTSYFIRARAAHWNFSTNPTFITGSDATFSNVDFTGNPQTWITTIGLYDTEDRLVAMGRLSTPVLKNASSELMAKVKLVH